MSATFRPGDRITVDFDGEVTRYVETLSGRFVQVLPDGQSDEVQIDLDKGAIVLHAMEAPA